MQFGDSGAGGGRGPRATSGPYCQNFALPVGMACPARGAVRDAKGVASVVTRAATAARIHLGVAGPMGGRKHPEQRRVASDAAIPLERKVRLVAEHDRARRANDALVDEIGGELDGDGSRHPGGIEPGRRSGGRNRRKREQYGQRVQLCPAGDSSPVAPQPQPPPSRNCRSPGYQCNRRSMEGGPVATAMPKAHGYLEDIDA